MLLTRLTTHVSGKGAMPTVADLCQYLEHMAPVSLAEDWDNVGLLVGRRQAPVGRVMTCLTLTPDVADEAVSREVQLVVSHHPLMFRATRRINDDSVEGRILLRLIENGVAVYSPHTAFDSARRGINQRLAVSLGLQGVRPMNATTADPDVGAGRCGELPQPLPLFDFLKRVAAVSGADRLEYTETWASDRPVWRVAIGCGAAEGFLADAIRLECDTFVTGEVRFHSALEAVARRVHLILMGHFHSERPAVEDLSRLLAAEFPGVDVFASHLERNPLTLYTATVTK